MSERQKMSDVIADLERAEEHFQQIRGALAESGLSPGAAVVLRKLREADRTETWRRTYKKASGGFSLADVLSERELTMRGYVATDEQPVGVVGSAAGTDKVVLHTTENPLYEDVWVGEPLINT